MDIVMDILMGAGSIVLAITPLLIPQVREFLIKGYQNSLDKALEDRKSKNERKNYVSKIRFDKEFDVHKELSSVFFELATDVNSIISPGIEYVLADEEKQRAHEDKCYKATVDSRNKSLDILRKNAIFISKSAYDKYYEILTLSDKQIRVFRKRYNASYIVPNEQKRQLDFADYERTEEINKKLDILNDELREYLQNLEVIN